MTAELSSKQKEALILQARILEATKQLMVLLANRGLTDLEVNLKVQEIYSAISSIGTIVGGRMSDRIARGLLELRKDLALIKSVEGQFDVKETIEDWISGVNTLVVKFSNDGKPIEVMFDFGALGVSIKALLKRGQLK